MTLRGDPAAAAALRAALDVAGEDPGAARALTHGFHTYAARMHPLTARRALALLAPSAPAPAGRLLVLDPFCGSGTVLVEARRAGLRAVGVDLSPIAVLVARARTWPGPAPARRALEEAAHRIAAAVHLEGKAARRAGHEPPPRQPVSAAGLSAGDREAALRGWFAPHVRRELEALAVAAAAERDPERRELLRAVLSSIVIKVSRRESDASPHRLDRQVGRGLPARLFADRATELCRGLEALDRATPPGTPAPDVRPGDARHLDRAGVASGSVDVILTSPPYAGTYDYLEQQALRLALLGLPVAPLERGELGARRAFEGAAGAVAAALATWERAYAAALTEMARALAPGGRAAVLVGDSLAGAGAAARAVRADEVTERLAAAAGLRSVAVASQVRAPLGSGELQAFDGPGRRPKLEHLVLLERPRA